MTTAEEHWEWLAKVLKIVYITAFEHGEKHGKEQRGGGST
jgi:hypothetical protein